MCIRDRSNAKGLIFTIELNTRIAADAREILPVNNAWAADKSNKEALSVFCQNTFAFAIVTAITLSALPRSVQSTCNFALLLEVLIVACSTATLVPLTAFSYFFNSSTLFIRMAATVIFSLPNIRYISVAVRFFLARFSRAAAIPTIFG